MKHLFSSFPFVALLTGSIYLSACSSGPDDFVGEETAVQTTQHELLPSRGLMAYPKLTAKNAAGTTVPVLDANGKPSVGWMGSLADLMAGDAFALCMPQAGAHPFASKVYTGDTYIKYLHDKMVQSMSLRTGTTFLAMHSIWFDFRRNATLNFDSSSGLDKAVIFPTHSTTGYTLFSTLPAGTNQVAADAAQVEVTRAEFNLCMAQRLREQMNSAQGLLLGGADQLELLEVTRERAQLAMLQYSLLGMAFNSADTASDASTSALQVVGPLHAWAALAGSATALATMGADFAAAIRLHTEVTRELGEVLVQSASARLPIPGFSPATLGDQEWAFDSWRRRVLTLLYGGDPLKGFNGNLWQSYAGTDNGTGAPSFKFVTEDIRTPQTQTLFALARKANALYLRQLRSESSASAGTVNVEDSANRLYRAVEASLRHPECITGLNDAVSPCVVAGAAADIPLLADFTSALLWQRHQVSPDHARSLVRALAQAAPMMGNFLCDANGACIARPKPGALHFTGTHHLFLSAPMGGHLTSDALPGGAGQSWYHLDPKFAAAPLALGERGLQRLATRHIPLEMKKASVSQSQGFAFKGDVVPLLTMGAVSALVATRDAIIGMGAGTTAALQGFVRLPRSAVNVITAAVGARSVSIRPKVEHLSTKCRDYDSANTGDCMQAVHGLTGTTPLWVANVTIASSETDPKLAVVDNDRYPMAGTMGLDSGSHFGLTATPPCSLQPLTGGARRSPGFGLAQLTFSPTATPSNLGLFLLGDCAVSKPQLLTVQTTISAPRVNTTSPLQYAARTAYYFADGGLLGEIADRALSVQTHNWARPALDGFGLPLDYVPPVDPNLLGNSPDPLEHYLALAEGEARNASNQTKTAIEALIQQDLDATTADQARRESATLIRNENTSLCGSATCAVVTVSNNLFQTLGTGARINRDRSSFVKLVTDRLPSPITILQPVSTTVANAQMPDFGPNYAQSTLRIVAEAQWKAIRKARDLLDQAEASGAAVMAQVDEARTQLANARAADTDARAVLEVRRVAFQNAGLSFNTAWTAYTAALTAANTAVQDAARRADHECSDFAMDNAIKAGISFNCGDDDDFSMEIGEGRFHYHCDDGSSRGFSQGPYAAQIKLCRDAKGALTVAEAQSAAALANEPSQQGTHSARIAYIDAIQAVNDGVRHFGATQGRLASVIAARFEHAAQFVSQGTDVAGTLRAAEGDAGRATLSTKHNTTRIELSTAATDARLMTRLGTYQRYNSVNVERARKAIRAARKYAVQARRALEERFVIDLSTMTADEFNVDPPATWADSVYDTDLNVLSATGLNVSATAGAGGTHWTGPPDAEKIMSYVADLRRLRNDFFISRPTLAARNDVELFGLPGPGAFVETEVNGEFVSSLDPEAMKWTFFCSATNSWIAHPGALSGESGSLRTACGGAPPARARMTFTLDPWGRLTGDVASPPLGTPQYRHNARWTRLALNLTGSGILNCGTDIACAEQEAVRFSLQHLTPAWITDRDQNWRVLAFPVGRIEGGKAAAAGLFLTAVTNSWNLPEIANIVRQEYDERPLGGAYQLEFEAGPQVILENIQRVQVLTALDYWVRAQ